MLRRTLLILSVAAASASAQTDTKAWTGVWEGNAVHSGTTSPNIPLRIEIARDASWSITMHVVAPDHAMTAAATDIAVEANRGSWGASFGDMSCKTTAVVEGSKLKGETKCSETASLSFELTKRQEGDGKNPSPKQPH